MEVVEDMVGGLFVFLLGRGLVFGVVEGMGLWSHGLCRRGLGGC